MHPLCVLDHAQRDGPAAGLAVVQLPLDEVGLDALLQPKSRFGPSCTAPRDTQRRGGGKESERERERDQVAAKPHLMSLYELY